MLPGPDIPATLGWRPTVRVVGPAAGWVVLLFKLIVAGTALFTIPVVRTATIRIRYAPVIDVWAAALDAADELLGRHATARRHPFYGRRRQTLERVVAVLPDTARYAGIHPHLRALLATLPPEDLTQAPDRTRIAAALLSYRSAARDEFGGAIGLFDNLPGWLAQTAATANTPDPDATDGPPAPAGS